MSGHQLDIISLNTNGLGNKVKREAVFRKLKQKGKGIFLLQETHSTEDVVEEWNRQWGNKNTIYSHGVSNSRGVAVLFSQNMSVDILKECKDDNGRFIIIDVSVDDTVYTIGNLYAPTRNFVNEQIAVFDLFCTKLQEFSLQNVVFGGDLNLYMNLRLDKLDSMPEFNDNANYRAEVISFMETHEFIDIWRTLNPYKKVFTWSRGKSRSRLDYLITSEHLLNSLAKVDILPGIHSDHSLIKLSLNNSATQHTPGKGFWKFNSSLLADSIYVEKIKEIIESCHTSYGTIEDKRVVWELIKLEIRSFTVPYSIRKKNDMNKLEKDLNNTFSKLHEQVHKENVPDAILEEYNIVKNELEWIEKHKARGCILRSKCQWIEEGEKTSSYFLRQEKQNYCNKFISQLEIDGNIITDPTEILEAEKKLL